MMNFIKSPLLWFILLGSSLFIVDQYRNVNNDRLISITQGDIDKIRSQWEAQSDKPLTDQIVIGLLKDEINQRRLYKEALSLNLDHDDVIIKRRLIQKLRFVMSEFSNSTRPLIAELRQYYENNKAKYIRSPAISFRHIFLGQINFGKNSNNNSNYNSSEKFSDRISTLLTELNQSTDKSKNWQLMGEPFMHGNSFLNHSVEQLLLQFNPSFIDKLMVTETGRWTGPLDSLYGSHLVFLENVTPVIEVEFEELKNLIEHDYRQSKQADNYQAYLEELAVKYPFVLEIEDNNLKNLLIEKKPSK